MGPHCLDRLFAPRAIAVFGASEEPYAVGARVFQNIVAGGYDGPLYPVNPKHAQVGGYPCYPSIAAVPTPVDLAVIATPAATVPEVVRACGEHGVRAAIVHSAGFGEVADGAARQKALLEEARRSGLRILGPNCLGFIRPALRLNATFSRNNAVPGPLALVSQSGGLCTAILDWAAARQIGFSAVVSLGAGADIDFGGVLDYLALDPHTESILLYVEGVSDARVAVDALPPRFERYGHMAIHPYPAHLATHWQLADGTDIVIRPIRPEDAEIEQAFVRNLSPQSRYFRFMQTLRELTPEMLVRFTQIDYDRELALIAVTMLGGKEVELAVGRYITNPDGESCEFALVVADEWQGKGVGTRLMQGLIEAARARGLRTMDGEVLANNAPMLDFVADLGFEIRPHPNDASIKSVLKAL